jgi:hypothetical protein
MKNFQNASLSAVEESAIKPPRWLVLLLVSLTIGGLVAIVGLWWINWPSATARSFLDHYSRGEVEGTNSILRNAKWICAEDGATLFLQIDDEPNSTLEMHMFPLSSGEKDLNLVFERRSALDLVIGRQRLYFRCLSGEPGIWKNDKAVHLVVERGTITYRLLRCPGEEAPRPRR